jgi:hypothetical protein
MPDRHGRLSAIVATLSVTAAISVGGFAWVAINDRDATIAEARDDLSQARARMGALEVEQENLLLELEAALRIGERLSDRVDTLERDLAEARGTRLEVREIRGTADFPIQRAMADAGDTVAGFAAREGTTEAVVRALNPWLEGTETLETFQTLWVPKQQ